MTDPIEVAPGVEVQDAFVDLKGASAGELKVIVDEPIERSSAMPVPASETGDFWVAENDAGLFWGWNDGPVQPPADTSPYKTRYEVEHEELGTVERVHQLDHVVKREQNRREPQSVLGVNYINKYPNTIPTRVETAQEIVDRYVNGPLGTDEVAYWWYRNTNRPGSGYDTDFEGYLDCDVVLYKDRIYTWKLKREQDVTDDDELYQQ